MKSLDLMVVKSFLKIFIITIFFFVFLLELVDLFSNLWRYMNNNAAVLVIGKSMLLYIPKCILYSIPPSLLFSVSFTLGSFYSENELIAVFGSGISLFRFTLPLIIFSIILSISSFYFNDGLVIKSYKQKVNLTNKMLGRSQTYSNTNVTVISRGSIIYDANYYNDSSKTLSGLTVIIRNSSGKFISRIDCEWAVYKNNIWEMHKARIFDFKDGNFITESIKEIYSNQALNESPDTFKREIKDINQLPSKEAKMWIESLRKSGLPGYRKSLTDYYERFSFSLTPFIVVLLSAAIGGRFKKNVLLMSLLSSLGISVVYYVMEMVLVILAKQGYIHPVTGAWGTFILFSILGFFLFHKART